MEIHDDLAHVDFEVVHRFLANETYWARDIPRDVLARAIEHSINFSGWVDGQQVAYARVVTDRATFAYLADVFVLSKFRGRGYSAQLMQRVLAHPDLQKLRRFMLCTSDAHRVYARFGFASPRRPEIIMERWDPDVYAR